MAVFSSSEQMTEGGASPCGASLVLRRDHAASLRKASKCREQARCSTNHLPPANSEDFHKVSPGTSVDAMCNEDHVSYLRQQKVDA
jgi:hypothetical protein